MRRALILSMVCLFALGKVLAQAPGQLQKPLTRVELLALFVAGQGRLWLAVEQRGIDFQPTQDYLNGLKAAGALDILIEALRKAPAPAAGATPVSPREASRENQVLQHLMLAAKLKANRALQDAEQEFRAALAGDPKNPVLHVDLATVLPGSRGEPGWDAAIDEDREAIRLQPDLAAAHFHLAFSLDRKGDLKHAIAEYREVVRLDPDDVYAWQQSGKLLAKAKDLDGAVAAYKHAVGLNPAQQSYRLDLAGLLDEKGDVDGAISQAREAIQLAPDYAGGHLILAKMLQKKGEDEEAGKEMQIAATLQARNPPKQMIVSGQVMAARLSHQVRPAYPESAKKAGTQGTVHLEVVVGKDGKVHDMKVAGGDPVLAKAAMKAVAKWRYQPTLLNGEPAEVLTEVNINFTFKPN